MRNKIKPGEADLLMTPAKEGVDLTPQKDHSPQIRQEDDLTIFIMGRITRRKKES